MDRGHYRELIERFGELTVVVVGDVCLDRYVMGKPTRLSREAPIAVLEWSREYCLPGEASNPVINLTTLGATAYLVAVTGEDASAAELRGLLEARGGRTGSLVADPARRTTEKTRVLAEGLLVLPQQLARIDRVDRAPLTPEQESEVCTRIEALASAADAILVSDYHRGTASPRVIECVRRVAGAQGVLATVDSQGDLYRFTGFGCVRCNRPDAEAVLGRQLATEADFERELQVLWERLECGSLVVTRDGQGISAYSRAGGYFHIPGVPVPVADAVGAGDTVISVLTLALAAGEPLRAAVHIANQAAALTVQHVGNSYPSPKDLLSALESRAHG